jgi:hypothetical protein
MSQVVDDFKKSISLAESLLRIENENFHYPPRVYEQTHVQGLRGGAAVLMVAAFENFLRSLNEYNLSELISSPPIVDFMKLPDKMQIKSTYASLEWAMKGKPYEPSKHRIDRIGDIKKACNLIISTNLNVKAFSETSGNPNHERVAEMFKDIGVPDVFVIIKIGFEREWRQPISNSFIPDKLDEIVIRRHVVAHTGNALNITRNDLKNSIRFLKVLANRLDISYRDQIRHIIKTAAV